MKEVMDAFAAFGPGDLRKVLLPVPEPDDYEVLVEHEGCVFCNTTDRMIAEELAWTKGYPVIFGHESFGRVVKLGSKVENFALGDRVICSNAVVRGFDGTYHSTWGGFAQYGIAGDYKSYLDHGGDLEGENAYRRRYAHNLKIDPSLPPEKACLAFSLAETASALKQVGDLQGKTVVVIGTGFVGYSFVYFAKEAGAKNVICLGRRKERLEIAEALGADYCRIDLEEAKSLIRSLGGADAVLEASGNPRALEKGLPYLKEGGVLAVYAVPHEPYFFDLLQSPKEFRVQRIGPQTEKALDEVCARLAEGSLPWEKLLTHQWRFEQFPEAYEQVKRGEVIKGLVRMK